MERAEKCERSGKLSRKNLQQEKSSIQHCIISHRHVNILCIVATGMLGEANKYTSTLCTIPHIGGLG